MKIKLLLLGINILFVNLYSQQTIKLDNCTYLTSCDSQDIKQEIIYDFKTKTFFHEKKGEWKMLENLNKLKIYYNKKIRFRVININRYLYDIDLNVNNLEFESEPPPIFNTYFLGQTDVANKLIDNQVSEFEGTNELNKFITEYFSFQETYNALIDNLINSESDSYKPQCSKDPLLKFSSLSLQISKLKIEYNNALEFVENRILEFQSSLKKDTIDLNNCLNSEKNLDLNKNLQQPKLDCDSLTIKITRKEIEIGKLKNKLIILKDLWENTIKPTDEKLIELVVFNNNFVYNHYYFISPPIYPKGNHLKLELSVTPNDSAIVSKKGLMPMYNDSLSIEVPVLWKPFIGFSTGPFFTIGNNLQNQSHTWQAQPNNGVVSDTSQFKLVSNGNGSNPMGIAAFANIGTKASHWFGFGASIGVGISIEERPRPTYFGGVSLFFGDYKQFNITGGIVATHVNSLNANTYPDINNTTWKFR